MAPGSRVFNSGSGAPPPDAPAPVGRAPGVTVVNEGWAHVPEGGAITYRNNPPASGPHYPVWLRYREYTVPMARGHWVHNLEHGAVVVLYRPDAPAEVVRRITEAFRSIPGDPSCGHPRARLTPDPLGRPDLPAIPLVSDGVYSCHGSGRVQNDAPLNPSEVLSI